MMIYFLEDDTNIRELVVYTLKKSDFEAEGFSESESFEEALKIKKPKLILLDVMLPGKDGLTVLKELKASSEFKNIPVIMVTAKTSEFDKVTGLDEGADDYIGKPFGIMELISRIKAVLRRSNTGVSESSKILIGTIEIDIDEHLVRVEGEEVTLTLKEFELLYRLAKKAGKVIMRETLLVEIWGYDFEGESRTLDVHIRSLRSKLGSAGSMIETVRGVGYKLK